MTNRNFGLDFLRSFSILCVLISHLYLIYPPGGVMQKISTFFGIIDGVTIFFVLSGFLVGYRLLQIFATPSTNIKGELSFFFINRWFKTLPGYYLVLFLLGLLQYNYVIEKDIPIGEYALFLQNFNKNHPYFFMEAWSLSVEEWFYLLIPLLFALFMKIFKWPIKRSILIICMITLTVSHSARFFLSLHIDSFSLEDFGLIIRNRVVTRIDAPIFGVITAYYYYYFPKHFKRYRFKWLIVLAALLAFLFLVIIFLYTMISQGLQAPVQNTAVMKVVTVLYFDITQLCIALCIPYLFFVDIKWRRVKALVTYISKISYSVYLVHSSLIIAVFLPFVTSRFFREAFFADHKLMLLFLFITLVLISSMLLYHLVEVPFFNLKKRWISRLKRDKSPNNDNSTRSVLLDKNQRPGVLG